MRNIKRNLRKNFIMLLLVIIILAFGIPNLIQPSLVWAASATDYDFTDELDADRVGIGFKWQANTKTLTITAIKNSSAKITLPSNSTIDIQGDIENEVDYIKCSGKLTIKGNDKASLSVLGCYQYFTRGYDSPSGPKYDYACIYTSELIIDSGNIKIEIEKSYISTVYSFYGIKSSKVTINNGNVDINILGTTKNTSAICAYNMWINGGKVNANSNGSAISNNTTTALNLIINNGTIVATANNGYGINADTSICGGNVTALGITGTYRGFNMLPYIDPNCNWEILYSKDETNLNNATKTDITDIYTVYNSKIINIVQDYSTTKIVLTSEKDNICVDEKIKLVAEVAPENTTDVTTWSSSNNNIATVSKQGEVIGIAPGKVTITAKSGEYSASKDINIICRVTLNPNGIEGIEAKELYTDTNGRLEALPTTFNGGNRYNKWFDSNENEVTIDTSFTTNTTIYAKWVTRTILVSEQKNPVKYGETSLIKYDVTSDFSGIHEVEISNLPNGITLNSNQITFTEISNGISKGILELNISNTAEVCTINNLKIIIDDNFSSNNFSLKIEKADITYTKPVGKTLSYTGNAQDLITNGTTNDGTFEYSVDGKTFLNNIPTGINVGEYTIYYRVIGDSNHNDSEVNAITSIIKKVNSIFIENPSSRIIIEDGQEHELIKAGITNDGIIYYSLDGINYFTNIPKAKDKGIYKVYYKIIGDKNHLDSEINSINITIIKLLGDIDGNGKVNARDAKLALQYYVGKIKLTDEQKTIGDVNKDGKVNARDAKLILQYYVGKIKSF